MGERAPPRSRPLLSRRFVGPQVQSEDGKSSSAPTGAAPWLGVSAALAAASISGFAGVFLEKMFTSGPRLAVILSTRRERLQSGLLFHCRGHFALDAQRAARPIRDPAAVYRHRPSRRRRGGAAPRTDRLSSLTFGQCQSVGQRVMRRGLVQGFHTSTWVVVAVQVVGALCTAVVIKFAGNVSLCRGCASRVIHSSCNRSWRR